MQLCWGVAIGFTLGLGLYESETGIAIAAIILIIWCSVERFYEKKGRLPLLCLWGAHHAAKLRKRKILGELLQEVPRRSGVLQAMEKKEYNSYYEPVVGLEEKVVPFGQNRRAKADRN
jgi:hypothetical protein